MGLALDPTERRILGTLIEKELSVPESYPLTVNALVLGCNQRNNRDPESSYPEHEVQGALNALLRDGWAFEHEKAGGRTRRYAHRAREQLGVDDVDLAILAELLLRGPQSPPELERRAARMRPIGSADEVERRLEALAARPVPYVRLLDRRPGERVARWEHLLAKEGTAPAPVQPAAPDAVPAARSHPPTPAAPSPPTDPVAALRARFERLEREIAALREEM